ncbi:hypothetical protein ORI20_23575 [Mycobacterium sp. CVI_P3]|uniref:Uncharacterized protein n=1 Tax=Mycobacterium pinniadriaticum TaxID=2994102 RepID=A0ABT3SJH2_9MYCO|nr:hypothetical protein [Mycobacterium pinniadriaticum]MCX2933257.1 hypothetical protein [Mycobacterium pinniadriaticum]MCX2939679.1 hypothetical protein [Mycobacterium pinniadriaticum]
MASGTTKTAKQGRNRALSVRTWLGAGALTIGVGAAMAAASGVAQADTGAHHATGSSTSASKHEAGPKHATAGSARSLVKVSKPAASPAAAVTSTTRAQAKAKSAASSPSAASQTVEDTQTVDTPIGPITVKISSTVPDPGESGPVSLSLNASTPIGNALFSLSGNETFVTDPAVKATFSITDGTLKVPAPVALIASGAGAVLAGGLAAYDSFNSFVSAAQSGNVGGAILAWAEAAPKFTHALLFGTDTLTLPLSTGDTGPVVELGIPIGGLFSPLRSVSVSWDEYSYVDESTGTEFVLDAADINFAGSKFGGAAPAFLQLFGL